MPNLTNADRKKLISLLTESEILCNDCGQHGASYCIEGIVNLLLANGVTFVERIDKLKVELAEREKAVIQLRKLWQDAEMHICTMCEHFDHKTDGNIVYGNKTCGEIVGYPCCGKFKLRATDNNVGHKWIPVTERLPDDFSEFLCRVIRPISGGKYVRETRVLWCDYEKSWNCEGLIVTHWMPLPEPPKGEE